MYSIKSEVCRFTLNQQFIPFLQSIAKNDIITEKFSITLLLLNT